MSSSLLKRVLPPVLILAAGVAVAALLISSKPAAKPVKTEEKTWHVSVTGIHKASLSPRLSLYGKVESLLTTRLMAAQEADVVEMRVIEGDVIHKGQVLALLDDRDARLLLAQREAELQEAEAKIASEQNRKASDAAALPHEQRLLELARASVNRARNLLKKKVSSQSVLDDARKEVEKQALVVTARKQNLDDHAARLAELQARRLKALALRDVAQLALDRTQVIAPYDGQVTRVLASIGQRMRKGDGLIEVYGDAGLILRAQIPSRYVNTARETLSAGNTLRVRGDIDKQPVEATLIGLAGSVRTGSGGVEGLFRIRSGQGLLQQGRFVRLDLTLPPQSSVIALPQEAIYGTGKVYRIVDGRMQGLDVERVGETLDETGQTMSLVRSEQLRDGDEVVTTRLPSAMDGLLVQIVDPS